MKNSKKFFLCMVFPSVLAGGCWKKTPPICGSEYIPNGSFEEQPFPPDFPASEHIFNIDPGIVKGGWYGADNKTPDMVSEDQTLPPATQLGSATSAPNGKVWVNVGSPAENLGVKLIQPLKAGEQYVLSFHGNGEETVTGSNPRIKVYVGNPSVGSLQLSQNNVSSYQEVASKKFKQGKWKYREFHFTSDSNASHILFYGSKGYQIDNISLRRVATNCNADICQPLTANLVEDPSFEDRGNYLNQIDYGNNNIIIDPHPWDWNFPNYSPKYCDASDCSSNWQETTKTPIKEASTHRVGNSEWLVLNTMKRNVLLPTDDHNSAVVTKLRKPLIPGQKYKISYFGATKDPFWFYKSSEIDIGFIEQYGCYPFAAGASSNCWADPMVSDQVIVDDFELVDINELTDDEKWYHYSHTFVANGPHEFMYLQAQDGYEPAFDDLCLTSENYAAPIIYYNTRHRTHRVDQHKLISVIKYAPSYNLSGLEKRVAGDITPVDNVIGLRAVDPMASTVNQNLAGVLPSPTPLSDVDYESDVVAFAVGDGQLLRISALTTQTPQEVEIATAIPDPFSIELVNNYIITAKGDRLAITHKNTWDTAEIMGHGITNAAFMDYGTDDRLYISDRGRDAIVYVEATKLAALGNQLDQGSTPNVGAFDILSQDPILGGSTPTGGPMGIDEYNGIIWVTVDGGLESPGRIVRFDTSGKYLGVYLDDIAAPKDILAWVP